MKVPCVTLMLAALIGQTQAWAQQSIRIESTLAVERRIPIAVPACAALPGQDDLGEELAAVITDDLRFSGYCTLLERDQYPPNFLVFTADPTKIDFEQWRKTGIEFLVYAFVTRSRGRISAQCRLFDVLSGRQVVGQRLETDRKWLRALAHKFSDEIVRYLTGVPGIASSQICFSVGEPGKKEIYVADYDGANLTRVTRHNSISVTPALSPDSTQIAYISYKTRNPFLYIVDLPTGRSRTLSKRVGLNALPAWAPDGKTLAIVLSKDGNPEIYLVNVDGSGLRRLTYGRSVDSSPTFHPSGAEIAFISDRAGTAQIYAVAVDGSNLRRLSFQGGRAYDPAWSPDGKAIAYVVEKAGAGLEIYVMNPDGTNARPLTDSPGGNEAPSWSPDSRHIVFATTRRGRSELWTVNIETGEQDPIPLLTSPCQGPSWGPRRP